MNNDLNVNGTRKTVLIHDDGIDNAGSNVADDQTLAGRVRESATFDDANHTVLNSYELTGYYTRNVGGVAYAIRPNDVFNVQRLVSPAGWRHTETQTTYNTAVDLPVTVTTLMNNAAYRCTQTGYTINSSIWLYVPYSVASYAGVCGVAAQATSAVTTWYDGHGGVTDTPAKGNVTQQTKQKDFSQALIQTNASYDNYGRVLQAVDGNRNNPVATSYSPSTGYAFNGTTVTNPLGQSATTVSDVAFGSPTSVTDRNGHVTRETYDALGRLSQVFTPTETGSTPEYAFSYYLSAGTQQTSPPMIQTDTLQTAGVITHSYVYVDGWGQARETQVPAEGSGRVVSFTMYDDHGRTAATSPGIYNNGAPGTVLLNAWQGNVPSYAATGYDNTNRPVWQGQGANGVIEFSANIAYYGDHVSSQPPVGGRHRHLFGSVGACDSDLGICQRWISGHVEGVRPSRQPHYHHRPGKQYHQLFV